LGDIGNTATTRQLQKVNLEWVSV